MPKIPTFTARATPTTEVASIKTGLKLSPTATPAAGLLPAAKAIDEYYIKQRDNNPVLENLSSTKANVCSSFNLFFSATENK